MIVPAEQPRTYSIYNRTRECYLCLTLRPSASFGERWRSLFARQLRRGGEGFRIDGAAGLWTLGNRAPVDRIYLDAQHRVVHVVEHASSRLIRGKRGAVCVLELPAYTIFCSQTAPGDQLLVSASDDQQAYWKEEAS